MRGAATTKARRIGNRVHSLLFDAELPPLDSLANAEKWAAVIARAVATGRLSAHAGNAAMRAVSEFRQTRAAVNAEERIAQLEAQIAALKKNGSNGSGSSRKHS